LFGFPESLHNSGDGRRIKVKRTMKDSSLIAQQTPTLD
jgi:hypothetical protein